MITKNQQEAFQDSFIVVEKLAMLCSTPGIDDKTKELANQHIQTLLSGAVKIAVANIGAKGSGLLT